MPDEEPQEHDHDDAAGVAEAPAEPKTDRPAPGPSNKPKPKILPPHAVVLHNDAKNGFEFVVASLMKVFRYNALQAFKLTDSAHLKGRSIVWTGQKEHAELKAEQLKSRGADPSMKAQGAQPLRVTVEPLPG